MTIYETWYNRRDKSTTCATSEEIERQRTKGLIGPGAELFDPKVRLPRVRDAVPITIPRAAASAGVAA